MSVMSDKTDSDDTDILLLIPPSYYSTNAEGALQKVGNVENIFDKSTDELSKNEIVENIIEHKENEIIDSFDIPNEVKSCLCHSINNSIDTKFESNQNNSKELFSKDSENTLQEINSRRSDWKQLPATYSLENISDISSVSGCQHIKCLSNVPRNRCLDIFQTRYDSTLLHSTLKSHKSNLHEEKFVKEHLTEEKNENNATSIGDLNQSREYVCTDGNIRNPGIDLNNIRAERNIGNDFIKDKEENQTDCIYPLSTIDDSIQINKDSLHYSKNLFQYLQNNMETEYNKHNLLHSHQEIMSATKFILKSNSNQQACSSSSLCYQASQNLENNLDNEINRNHVDIENSSICNGDGQEQDITPTFTNASLSEELIPRCVASTNTPVDYFARTAVNDKDRRNDSTLLRKNDNLITAHNHSKPKYNSAPILNQCKDNFNKKNECRLESLISLAKIWGNKDSNQILSTQMASNTVANVDQIDFDFHSGLQGDHHLMEEQLRRLHLEKTVRDLQSVLLEYQQRISVAIEVDKSKDEALKALKMERTSLCEDIQSSRQHLHNVEQRSKSLEDRVNQLQKELSQAIALSAKFQEKVEKLENESTKNSNKYQETCRKYKEEIDEKSIELEASQRSEELLINEMQKLKDKYAKSQHFLEKAKIRTDELQKENATLKHQKEVLTDCNQKQRARVDYLEKQKESLQETVSQLTEVETSLKRKLELQQKSLKSHYQTQLDNVMSEKCREFQEQFERQGLELIIESKEREQVMSDRAVKQIELIMEKNHLEVQLIEQRHNEECELYRIQLENATKTIEQLQNKIEMMKTKRVDIARQLHTVMEVQWQKALEILTSPNQTTVKNIDKCGRNDDNSLESNDSTNKSLRNDMNGIMDNNCESTQKCNKKVNNLNLRNNKSDVITPTDKLQAYIELLLQKCPEDFDKFDDIITLSTKIKKAKDKLEKNARVPNRNNKPPWKG